MIELKELTKFYNVGARKKFVAKGINLNLPHRKAIALLGKNGTGKSTLLRMIAGIELPSSGMITASGNISWPIGFGGSFHPDLTGAQNVRFVARIYGANTQNIIRYVKDFAELGDHFHAPYRTYSAGMKGRLGFGLSMGIEFDTYLIDEVTAVGDASFKAKSSKLLKERIGQSGAIIVSHSMGFVKEVCSVGVVLVNGHAKLFDDINEAISVHNSTLKGEIPSWANDKTNC